MDELTGYTADTPPLEEGFKPQNTKDSVKRWLERVSLQKRELENWAETSGANRFIDEHNGKFGIFFNGLKGKIPVPPINDVFAYVDADISITYNRDPYISINPKAGTSLGAKLWEAIINYWWRVLRTKLAVEREIMDKDLVGYGFHKVGSEVETEGAEEDLKLVKDRLYSDNVDWKDMVWNMGSKDVPYDCLWMAQRITKPLSFIKRKYPAAKTLKGVRNPEMDTKAYENAEFKDDIQVAVLWEIWDKETREVLLVAEGLNDKWLAPPRPWPDYMDEFPFLYYWDLFAPGKRRPMSAIASWEPQLLEKMVLMGAAVNHSKRWNRQMLVKKGAISSADLDKIERGDDGAIVDYTGAGELDKNIKVLDWGTVPVDFYLLMDRCAATQDTVSGQAAFVRGGVTKTQTRTDGELDKIAAGAKGRSDRRVDRFETHLENIARHMMKHLKANFDFEETVRITGEAPEELINALGDHFDPMTKTVTFTPEEIEGEYDVEIKAGSTLPLDQQTKMKLIESTIQTLGSLQGGASPLLQALISELLDAFDMKSLKIAFAEETKGAQEAAQAKEQEGDASEIKARSQAAKNVAQAQKISVETDAIEVSHPFVHGNTPEAATAAQTQEAELATTPE